jgi:hypothetical protein
MEPPVVPQKRGTRDDAILSKFAHGLRRIAADRRGSSSSYAFRAAFSVMSSLPAHYVDEENPARVVDAFVAELDLAALGFEGVVREATGRPAYHPAVLVKIKNGAK